MMKLYLREDAAEYYREIEREFLAAECAAQNARKKERKRRNDESLKNCRTLRDRC